MPARGSSGECGDCKRHVGECRRDYSLFARGGAADVDAARRERRRDCEHFFARGAHRGGGRGGTLRGIEGGSRGCGDRTGGGSGHGGHSRECSGAGIGRDRPARREWRTGPTAATHGNDSDGKGGHAERSSGGSAVAVVSGGGFHDGGDSGDWRGTVTESCTQYSVLSFRNSIS